MGASCFLMGNRDVGEEVIPALRDAMERHILQYGVDRFYVGHYGRFDRMAAQVIQQFKGYFGGVQAWMVLPYHPADHPISAPGCFDGTFYPWEDQRIPRRLAIVRTNRYMVETCDYLIAYAAYGFSNTGKLVAYAQKREEKGLIRVENLAQRTSKNDPR